MLGKSRGCAQWADGKTVKKRKSECGATHGAALHSNTTPSSWKILSKNQALTQPKFTESPETFALEQIRILRDPNLLKTNFMIIV
jgi:hypothetical protein